MKRPAPPCFSGRPLPIAALAALGACGGGAEPGLPGVPVIVRSVAFDTTVSRLEDLGATTDVPVAGEARYAGFIGITAAPDGQPSVYLTAAAEMTARFAGGTVSGRFGDVLAAGDPGARGSGDIDGAIGLSGISAALDGFLTLGGTGYAIDADLSAAFLGPGASGIAGTVAGDLRRSDDVAGTLAGEAWLIRD